MKITKNRLDVSKPNKLGLSSRKELLAEAEEELKAIRRKVRTNESKTPRINEQSVNVDFGTNASRVASAYGQGPMMWRSKTWLSKKDALAIMKKALPDGYNNFEPALINKLPADSKIQLAREYSVCLYVKTATKPSYAAMGADEIDPAGTGVYRIWWD